MGFFDSVRPPKLKINKKVESSTPTGVWKKCPACKEIVQQSRIDDHFNTCPYCHHHFRAHYLQWISYLCDPNSFQEKGEKLSSNDPLSFKDKLPYGEKLKETRNKVGVDESYFFGEALLNGQAFILGVMNFQFMGGSMGVVAGEKIAQSFELAVRQKKPIVIICCSGGARMQEGLLSLMQMGKTTAARHLLRKEKIPYISVLTDPTTGGVAASFALLGDIILAEPNSLIGFAGPRVIEQSLRQTLPEGFQRSEFLLDHGQIDRIVLRKDLKEELSFFISLLYPSGRD